MISVKVALPDVPTKCICKTVFDWMLLSATMLIPVASVAERPVLSLAVIEKLLNGGAEVLVLDHLPRDVPGLGQLDDRRRRKRQRARVSGLSMRISTGRCPPRSTGWPTLFSWRWNSKA